MNGIDHAMTVAAESLLSALRRGGRRHACYPFIGPARSQWSYLPGSRRGIALSELGSAGRKAAEAEYRRIADGEVAFGWAGGLREGDGHYYRIQAPGLLIEYDNTQRHANHAHTVLRRPGRDFGAVLLASHLAAERP
jgi:hypothetical protein